MSLLDTLALQPVLKRKYTQHRFNLLCYEDNPFFTLVQKDTDFGGDGKVVGFRYGVPQGRGRTIAAAQAGKTASAYGQFYVTRVSDYATASITGEAIRAAKGNANALIDGLTKEIDGATQVCMRSLAINMYRNGGGARGVISSGSSVSSSTITLATLADITNFEIGMQLQFASDDGSASSPAGLRNAGASAPISGVDRDLGTLTFPAALNSYVAAVATGDYLFQGVTSTANSDYTGMIKGISAWIPDAAPSSGDLFFGFNRTVDVTRTAGIRVNGNGGPIEETILLALTKAAREGGKTSHVFINPLDWISLVQALGSKVIYDRAMSVDEPDVGFDAIVVMGPRGKAKVISDLNCPQGKFKALQLDTWSFDSAGMAPGILDDDGLMIVRSPNSDDYEIRIGYYGNLICEAPGWNVAGTF